MAGEVVGSGPRIKYKEQRTGQLELPRPLPLPLAELAELMAKLEAKGMIPVLDDGLVGGNCAIAYGSSGRQSPDGNTGDSGSAAQEGSPGGILISRSGKQPGAALQASDWVLLTRFDAAAWRAEFRSVREDVRPSSDAPLHAAALGPGAAQRYRWAVQPLVAVHGHALAEGPALHRARQAGLPISDHETLFSTPEDRQALEALFRSHPYPAHRCYIRRGHGFLLLAQSVQEAGAYLEQHVLPLALPQADACRSL